MELNKTFIDGLWSKEINVSDFVSKNITSYTGDASFLQGPTERTKHIWNLCLKALEEERANNGVRSLDHTTVSTITSHKAGYIDKENELIVGLQTDELLRRAIKPFGGINVVAKACRENGVEVDDKVKDIFTHYRKTHNDGVFDVYTEEIRSFRSLGFLTGLPDNYARGRIIGDYRRLALYGIDRLIEAKQEDLRHLTGPMTEARIRLREEVAEQIKALKDIKTMGEYYGLDLSHPATSAQEAVQWVYMAYLAAVKEQDGAAMSLGNVSSFLDIFIEYDLAHGKIDETFAQELIDQFIIKLRMVRHLRMQSYNDIFAGDPTWVTEAIGGRFNDGRVKVTKTSFRFLQTLYNLGPSPEPNMTVLWSPELPEGFKEFCAKVSVDTSSIQYENDNLMREVRNCDDYGIACCVSYQAIGKQIQFFGARANLAKALLLAINGGRCENTGTVMVKGIPVLTHDTLNFEEVMNNYKKVLTEIARVYNEAMNIIHYMHDKYYYEKAQMAFVDTDPRINLAYGVAGLSIAIDSLSAIKYAKVTARRNDIGLTEGFDIEGSFPCFGNNDDRVDHLGVDLVYYFSEELKKLPVYKNARPTLSLLTITSNVMYGKKTGATPDGRAKGVAFAPGANPMHGRDKNGAIASLSSVAKLRYRDSQDGISNTFSIVPKSLGPTADLSGKKVLMTAGPTFEPFDPVRGITNGSSGRQAAAIAAAAIRAGAEVTIVSGPVCVSYPDKAAVIPVRQAQEMFEAVKKELAEHTPDTFIGVAAVGDWRPVEYSESKLKKEKGQDTLTIKLIKNPDILSYVGHSGLCSAVIGFAAETDNLAENARKKLDSKAADMIVVNPASAIGSTQNQASFVTKNGIEAKELSSKAELAEEIIEALADLLKKRVI